MSTTIAIIDYGSGNIRSLQYALDRLGVIAIVTDDVGTIEQADKVIFPGVGHAVQAMKKLKESKLDLLIPTLQQPVLGICLGMQLMCRYSEEGEQDGLSTFDLEVKRMTDTQKLPHMGWNTISSTDNRLFSNIEENSHMYFVHSYSVELSDATIATCDYGKPFAAAIQKDNFYATQFHPEKSGLDGIQLLKNFIQL